MTRRERMERRAERRREWAESRERKSSQAFDAAHRIADNIPLGQPILVGHHSERHARRDAARIHSNMSRGVESAKMAEEHTAKAGGIERQLANSIFSDDPNAEDALEVKAAAIVAEADRGKAINAAFRKAPGADAAAKLAALVEAGTITREEGLAGARNVALCWSKLPVSPYTITNARANARRLRERIKGIRIEAARKAEAEAAPGGVLVKLVGPLSDHACITFPDYPGREVVAALKAAGFWWSRPSWHGPAANVPECVREMAEGGAA